MKSTLISQHIQYNLYDDIDSFDTYTDFFEEMALLNNKDKVTLRINSGGGRIDVGHMIVQAIQETKAFVSCIVAHASYSMASIIALSGDELLMLPNSLLMFHNYSTGMGGKGGELIQGALASDEYIRSIMNDVCTPFLSRDEMRQIAQDRDIYVKYSDANLSKRIKRHYKRETL